MTRLGIVGDIHLAATPPGRRTETYLADVQAKLTEIAQAEDVDHWLLIGDLFHHKRANRVPYSLTAWLWSWIGSLATSPWVGGADRFVYIVPGNHDLADGSIESIERQPLGILENHPRVAVARGVYTPSDFPEGGYLPTNIIWSAGLQDGIAVPGTGAVCDAAVDPAALFYHDVDWVFAHAPVDTVKRPWATYDAATIPLHPRTKGIVYGHQHDTPGLRPNARADGKLVIATGSVSRGSISEADHAPAWMVLDTDTGAVDVRPIQCARPSVEVFRWAERAAEKAEDDTMASFTQALRSETLTGFSRETLAQTIAQRTDLEPAVRDEAVGILSAT